ncbi:aldo/keto reductase [Francisella sp. 19X1-34]|uniref:aldo/keto reductase n=1 Tax=Francisella sp. 19X1-34 TaxID=3087177 RepID=UPI002E3561C0|nr:aldo/keto reductase [Francisella sp. 19X1-34]MED7789471.1 aldo/keto reductase [Francisella sp. 19X1-34]
MKEFTLNNGNKIPVLGLGTYLSDNNDVYKAVKHAIKNGYRHIDCAYFYGNEDQVGKAIKECLEEDIVKREDLFITSKLWNAYHKYEQVKPALLKTLNNLDLEYLDLYLIHWPVATKVDVPTNAEDFISLDEAPIIDTWKAMESLVDDRLVKNIGVSNFSIKKLKSLLEKDIKIKPVTNQVEVHPYFQQKNLLNFCKEQNILLTAYSPLGTSNAKDELLGNLDIIRISEKYNAEPAQVILAWLIEKNIIAIPKSITPERIDKNLVSQYIKLDSNDIHKLNSLDKNHKFIRGDFFALKGSPYTLENVWDEIIN